ncbi:hypothetical protein GCM10007880_66060 [Mesorhizobium amorphae]|nr:hypothetical protein GCM10007880_66060 [Mesorhizobium amorphae]
MAALADNRLKAVFGMAILSADRSEIQPSWGVPWDAQPYYVLDECHGNSWAKYCATMKTQLACHQTDCEQRPQIGGIAPLAGLILTPRMSGSGHRLSSIGLGQNAVTSFGTG